MFQKFAVYYIRNARCMAGHSKWANIKHIKGAKDAEKSIQIQRIIRQVKVAIKENGSADPKTNLRLAHVLEQARTQSLPMERINQAVKADNSKEDSKAGILEVRGPGGCIFVVEILTNNITRTRQLLSVVLKKYNGSWTTGGMGRFFSYKGIVKVKCLNNTQTLENATEHGIEVGAEDVTEENGKFVFLTDPQEFFSVMSSVERIGYQIVESSLLYVPVTKVSLNQTDLENASELYQKILEDPDVVKIHDNIE